MHLIVQLLAGLAVLSRFAGAAPASSTPPFQITKTETHAVTGGNTTIRFHVYDANPLTNSSTVCTGSWPTNSTGYPQGSYESCRDETFAWNMMSFTNIGSFVLGIEHVFTDPAVGAPPWDEITNFGNANVSAPAVRCFGAGGEAGCTQSRGSVIQAPIYASIAK